MTFSQCAIACLPLVVSLATGCGTPATNNPEADATTTPHAEAGTPSGDGSLGTVTFTMEPPPGDAGYSFVESFGNPGDGFWWYSLAKADGGGLQLFYSEEGPFQTCGGCAPLPAAPIGFGCSQLKPGYAVATWNGLVIAGISTCQGPSEDGGGPPGSPCYATQRMPAGDYVVTMCATKDCNAAENERDAGAECITVPFHYPTNTNVVGTLH